MGLGRYQSDRISSFASAINKQIQKRRADNDPSSAFTLEELETVFYRKFRRLELKKDTFNLYRAQLGHLGYLRYHWLTRRYHWVNWPAKSRGRTESICGQNAFFGQSYRKKEKADIKTKSLPAQLGSGSRSHEQPRGSRGRFVAGKKQPEHLQQAGAVDFRPDTASLEKTQSVETVEPAKSTSPVLEKNPPKPRFTQVKDSYPGGDALAQMLSRMSEQSLAEQQTPEYQAKQAARAREKAAYDAISEKIDADIRQRRRREEQLEREAAEQNREPHKPKRQIERFEDDEKIADALFWQFYIRQVPFLSENFCQDFIKRKYPRRIWRMAVAQAISRWPGQIKKKRCAYVLAVADQLAKGQDSDPRLRRDYRVVFKCAAAMRFAGVSSFTF